ncbi:C40 family peptidase [Herbaspirillum rhizosphaerae]|uniref:C40 family peptidase n=1 Tax=Herbaspirillum rhizosphaerae TaxID=346179 RepID=UPI00067C03BD|nr:C40 family peptidase [Herbaspirillum rhizosphaerae]
MHFLPARLLFVFALMLPACAVQAGESQSRIPSINRLLAVEALNSLSSGIRYRFGGTDPDSGLDCSAFVAYLFREASGGSLPRTAREIRDVGEPVSLNDMKPGDLVFFGKGKRSASHVGVYVGGKKFIHASRKHGTIYESKLDEPYWHRRFSGVRRLAPALPQS